jgi:hypothetical protein
MAMPWLCWFDHWRVNAMTLISKSLAAGWALGAVLCVPAGAATGTPGAMPGDEAMSCEQLASELAPYAQQMTPNLQALAMSQQQQLAGAQQKLDKRRKDNEALTPLATAGALDPTGASKRAYQAAATAQAAKEKSENEAEANSPLARQANAQREQVAAQGMQMYANARLQRLMQLGQQKGCGKR